MLLTIIDNWTIIKAYKKGAQDAQEVTKNMKKLVFRSESLKGIISKDRAIDLLGLELSVKTKIKGHLIEISRDDMYNINIEEIDEEGDPLSFGNDFIGYAE